MTDAALGNLLLRYTDAKRRQATLVEGLIAYGELLANVGDNLKTVRSEWWVTTPLQIPPTYPDRAPLEAQLADLRAASQDFQLARTQLTEAGIDLS